MAQFLSDKLSAIKVATLVKSGELSAREVTQDVYEAIEAREQNTHAYLELTREMAFETADRIDALVAAGKADELGVLAGVPVAFKDNMHLIGTRTTCGSRMLENYESVFNATCVQRMIDQDAICLGKLNMDEFAFGSSTETSAFGKTTNPWDHTRVPGGSSGGSAAAIADGTAYLTLGSDTGGSIRQPGAFCGCVALKPSYGVVSRFGVVAFGSSLDQVGPFGHTVADVALAMDALTAGGVDPRDCTSQDRVHGFVEALKTPLDPRNVKIGIIPELMEAKGLTDEVKTRIQEAANRLEQAGATLVEVELPHSQAAMSAYYIIGPSEAFSNLSRFDSVRFGLCEPNQPSLGAQQEASRNTGFGAEVKRRIMLGAYLLSSGVYEKYYYPSQQVRTLITQDYERAFEQVDAILLPTSPRTAFAFGEISDPTQMYLSDMFTVSINIAGNCGVNVPVGLGDESSLPVGAQLVGPEFGDVRLLQIAALLEQEYGSLSTAHAHHN